MQDKRIAEIEALVRHHLIRGWITPRQVHLLMLTCLGGNNPTAQNQGAQNATQANEQKGVQTVIQEGCEVAPQEHADPSL